MTASNNPSDNRMEMKRWLISLAALAISFACVAVSAQQQPASARALVSSSTPAAAPALPVASNDAAAPAAFLRAWTVFNSPRCRNCHPAGDAPLQGDDGHVHLQDVKRGPDGHGVYGMKCNTCHQLANTPGENMPPGNPKWSLPPPNMKMVIVGETPGQFCRQLKDPAQNGGRTLAQIITHVSSDQLVSWAWSPGDGRSLPPLTRPELVAAMREWVKNGAACPQ